MADLDLGGMDWAPIANFKGNFDGNDHTISNFKITKDVYGSTASNTEGGAVWGSDNITVKNVTFQNITIKNTTTTKDSNGKDLGKITVAEGKKLSLIDTITNDYDCSDGYCTAAVEGAYEATVDDTSSGSLKRYAVIADENGNLS